MADTTTHPFSRLSQEHVMEAVESLGYLCDGRVFPLNSYENRVYQVGIEDQEPLIAKFYRPDRWSAEQIDEEHDFTFELAEAELPVVAPLRFSGKARQQTPDFHFALFPRRGGHPPELDNPEHLFALGQTLGRMHGIGARTPFLHRPSLDPVAFGHDSIVLVSEFMPRELRDSYRSVALPLLERINTRFADGSKIERLRCHGDCHSGNMLWRDNAPHFVDFDDARNAPALQDIWMLLNGDHYHQLEQLREIVEGYEEFREFPRHELRLVEALRALRLLHHCAWLARRWQDPAFPRAFPWFNTPRYWGEYILSLKEQLAAMELPTLRLTP